VSSTPATRLCLWIRHLWNRPQQICASPGDVLDAKEVRKPSKQTNIFSSWGGHTIHHNSTQMWITCSMQWRTLPMPINAADMSWTFLCFFLWVVTSHKVSTITFENILLRWSWLKSSIPDSLCKITSRVGFPVKGKFPVKGAWETGKTAWKHKQCEWISLMFWLQQIKLLLWNKIFEQDAAYIFHKARYKLSEQRQAVCDGVGKLGICCSPK
jgi:hypothetical protein